MAERRLEGLVLKVGPLGEHDRLLTLLSEAEGVSRLAVPGARRPKSSLAAAAPLTLLELQVGGRSGLSRVRQLRIQAMPASVGGWRPWPRLRPSVISACSWEPRRSGGWPATLQLHLERLEQRSDSLDQVLASSVQGAIHLLSLGGYRLPLQSCCRSGAPLDPPIGHVGVALSQPSAEDGFAIDRNPARDDPQSIGAGPAATADPPDLPPPPRWGS